MIDRRRALRDVLCDLAAAEIELLQDVLLESVAGDCATVIASSPPVAAERLRMRLVASDGSATTLNARIVASSPAVTGGILRYRVQLAVEGLEAATRGAEGGEIAS